MILQALYEYYQRKPDLPREGFENKEIPFVIELNKSGSAVQIEDTRTSDGKKKRAKNYLIPQAAKKSGNVAANILWGNAEYVLGLSDEKKLADKNSKRKEGDYGDRLNKMHAVFVDAIKALRRHVGMGPAPIMARWTGATEDGTGQSANESRCRRSSFTVLTIPSTIRW